jgi:hypothetical protein
VKIRDRGIGMVFFPPVWVILLVGSLKNGSTFKQSLTYQYAMSDYSFWDLDLYLYLQLQFFTASLYLLGFVALYYLFWRLANLEDANNGGGET